MSCCDMDDLQFYSVLTVLFGKMDVMMCRKKYNLTCLSGWGEIFSLSLKMLY